MPDIKNFKNILVLAPHTDDGELGAGGTIAKLIESGSKVTYAAFSTASESIPKGFPSSVLKDEVVEATTLLGINRKDLIIFDYKVRKLNFHRQEILEDLFKIKSNNNFDLILTPSLKDIHQDHSTISNETIRAFKNVTILGYELIWNNMSFDTKCFVSIKKHHLDLKCKALQKYKSQSKRPYMSSDFIFSLALSRGVQSGCNYAECFEVLRLYL